jgi:hypothetical protein
MHRDSCGQTLNRLLQEIFAVTQLVILGNPVCGKDRLAFSSGTAAANGSATLNLALAGTGASAINWTLTYPRVANPAMAALLTTTAMGIGDRTESFPAGNALALFATDVSPMGGAIVPAVAIQSCRPAILSNSAAVQPAPSP